MNDKWLISDRAKDAVTTPPYWEVGDNVHICALIGRQLGGWKGCWDLEDVGDEWKAWKAWQTGVVKLVFLTRPFGRR